MLGCEREALRGSVGARRVGVGILVCALPPLAEGFLRGDRQVAGVRPQRGRERQRADGALLGEQAGGLRALSGGLPQLRVRHHRGGRAHGEVPHVRHEVALDVNGACTHVDEDRRDVDLDGADLATRATQGGGEGQGVHRIVLGEALGELRGQDRADGARVDGAIGVTGGVLVHRADVHARAAADAGQGLAADRVGEDLGAAVIHKDKVEFLGAVAGGDARPHGGVWVHALAGGGAGEQLGEDLHVLEAGHQLLDAHQGDEGVRQGQAHAAVALGLEDGDGAGFCDAHVGAGDGDLGVQELLT